MWRETRVIPTSRSRSPSRRAALKSMVMPRPRRSASGSMRLATIPTTCSRKPTRSRTTGTRVRTRWSTVLGLFGAGGAHPGVRRRHRFHVADHRPGAGADRAEYAKAGDRSDHLAGDLAHLWGEHLRRGDGRDGHHRLRRRQCGRPGVTADRGAAAVLDRGDRFGVRVLDGRARLDHSVGCAVPAERHGGERDRIRRRPGGVLDDR